MQAVSNFALRVVSAVVLIALALAATWAGGLAFRVFCAGIAAAVFYEWSAMMRSAAQARHHLMLGGLLGLCLLALIAGLDAVSLIALLAGATALGAVLAAAGGHGLWGVAGLGYAGLAAISLALLRGDEAAGASAIILLFAIIWATDILAYFVGKALGGPKLAPSISPGKTWSGAIGGTIGGVAAGVAAGVSGQTAWGPVALVLLAFALSVLSQVGDLFESSMKRRHGVKDSGHLIPGHGGVFDRVDGLVAAAMLMFVIGAFTAGPQTPYLAFFTR